MSDFENRIQSIRELKEELLERISKLLKELEALDVEEERLSDEEFVRTGSCTYNFNIDFEITQEDMLRELVERTEGNNIKIEKSEEN
jgi:hypothetical protein